VTGGLRFSALRGASQLSEMTVYHLPDIGHECLLLLWFETSYHLLPSFACQHANPSGSHLPRRSRLASARIAGSAEGKFDDVAAHSFTSPPATR
jgi:hypothetical protein